MNRSLYRIYLSILFAAAAVITASPISGYSQAAKPGLTQDLQARLTAIEAKAEARRSALGIPGMSLAIVKDGQVIYLKGLGYKDFEKKVPVTPETQFAIGSATKAFTALSVLISQDEGKISLDDSPKKTLSYFKMYDPETDKSITIRDLLSHSSGLNRTDLAMITGRLSRAELIRVAGEAKPTAKLREKFQYQNLMFTAAGEAVATVQKMPWEKFVTSHILNPLGMVNSSISTRAMAKTRDFSFGYDYNFDTRETRRLPFRDIDQVAPAGAINSSGRDMSRWLQFILNGGQLDGKRLVSAKGFEEWLKPQMKIGGTTAYGLGWFLQDWKGLRVAQHGGNIDGFNSMVAMIPEKKIGFVLLTNVTASPLGNEMMQIVWDGLLSDPKTDEAIKLPLKAMEKLVGKYRLAELNGNIEIKIDNNELLKMVVPGQPEYTLVRTGERQFKLEGAPDGFSVKFSPAQGNATEMELTQPNGVAVLKRIDEDGTVTVAEKGPGTSAPVARELIGRYESETSGKLCEIKETAGKVSFEIPGQPAFELVEKKKDTYALSPLPEAYWLEVKRDDKGVPVKIVVVQPEGKFGFNKVVPDETVGKLAVDDVMQRVIDAAGGEANWRKITSRITAIDIDFENQGVKATAISYSKAPNLSATRTRIFALGKEIGNGLELFDGTAGEEVYSFAPVDRYSGKRLEDARLGADFYGLLNWKKNYKKVEIAGTAKVGGEPAYIISFESESGSKILEYYSKTSYLLLKREGVVTSSTSNVAIPYTITFSDYRDVDGIKLPFKSINMSISNGNIVSTIKDVKHNQKIDESVFHAKN